MLDYTTTTTMLFNTEIVYITPENGSVTQIFNIINDELL